MNQKKHSSKESCSTCRYFTDIKGVVGFCSFLAILLEKGVIILDIKSRLEEIKETEQTLYDNPVVEAYFSCSHYELDKQITLL